MNQQYPAANALGGVVGEFLAGMEKGYRGEPGEHGEPPAPGVRDSESGPGGKREDTAKNAPVPTDPAEREMHALMTDPFAVLEQLGYKDRYTQITYNTIRHVFWRAPPLQAVVKTRVNQVASFAQPQHDRYSLGYRIKLRDNDKEPTGADKKWGRQCEALLANTGLTKNPQSRDSFATFLKKITRDTMMFDALAFEVVPNKKGQPAEWYAVDASTIRLADTHQAREEDQRAVRYVQIYDGMIVAEFKAGELAYGVRNPHTDIRLQGYGVSEPEMMIEVITAWLFGFDYNKKAFSQGSQPKGVFNLKGPVSKDQLQAFRRMWYAMLSGVNGAWRMPILNAPDAQWIPMFASNRDMEFNAWMDFLLKISCSLYDMDPAEVNFKYGTVGQKSTLSEENNRDKITESRERGLRPLLAFLAELINRYIIWPMNESMEFGFVGLDAKTRDDVAKTNESRVKTTKTINELRAEDGDEPLEEMGDVILDPAWMQAYNAKQQAAQQAAMGGQPGGDGQGGGQPGQPGGTQPGGGDDGDFDFESFLRQGEDQDVGADKVDIGKSYVIDVQV